MYPLLQILPDVNIPTYLVMISLACCIAILWVHNRAAENGLDHLVSLNVALIILVAGFAGGRLLHVVYEDPAYYSGHPLDVFKIWNGGFVFFGGFLTSLAAVFFYLKRRLKTEPEIFRYLDFFSPIVAFGYAIGRLGCFFNGCCYGVECPWPWGVEFPNIGETHIPRHATQIYAFIFEIVVVAILLNLRRFTKKTSGRVFFSWLLLHGIGRLFMEYFRGDDRGPILRGFSISSWIALLLMVSGLLGLLYLKQSQLRSSQT